MIKRFIGVVGSALVIGGLVWWVTLAEESYVVPEVPIPVQQASLMPVRNTPPIKTPILEVPEKGLSPDIRQTFNSIQQAREGRLHAATLDEYVTEQNEATHMGEVEAYLKRTLLERTFSEQDEDDRIFSIDYLGEKLRGRLASQYRAQIWSIMQDYLSFDVMKSDLEERKKKSILGDKVDMMEYVTLWSEVDAMKLLRHRQGMPEYDFLRIGVSNGLAKKGHSKEEIAYKLERL